MNSSSYIKFCILNNFSCYSLFLIFFLFLFNILPPFKVLAGIVITRLPLIFPSFSLYFFSFSLFSLFSFSSFSFSLSIIVTERFHQPLRPRLQPNLVTTWATMVAKSTVNSLCYRGLSMTDLATAVAYVAARSDLHLFHGNSSVPPSTSPTHPSTPLLLASCCHPLTMTSYPTLSIL